MIMAYTLGMIISLILGLALGLCAAGFLIHWVADGGITSAILAGAFFFLMCCFIWMSIDLRDCADAERRWG